MVKNSILSDKIKNAKVWLWEQQELLNAMSKQITDIQQRGNVVAAAMEKRRVELQNDRIELAKAKRVEKVKNKEEVVKKE